MTSHLTLLKWAIDGGRVGVDKILRSAEAVFLSLVDDGVQARLPEDARRSLLVSVTSALEYLEWCFNHHADRCHLYDNVHTRCVRSGLQYLLEDYRTLVTDPAQLADWVVFGQRLQVAKYDRQLRDLPLPEDEAGAGRAEVDAPPSHWWWD